MTKEDCSRTYQRKGRKENTGQLFHLEAEQQRDERVQTVLCREAAGGKEACRWQSKGAVNMKIEIKDSEDSITSADLRD